MNLFASTNPAFWQALDTLLASSEIVVDRAKGTAHPRMPELIYPLDYGYLAGTTSGDGQGIDVWIGKLSEKQVTAIGCTVDRYKRDAELKVLVGCTEQDVATISHFLNQVAGLPCVIIKRGANDD
ncbi:MAG: hypothetical protein U0175_35220 [Caldilineaceae bacterium]